MINIYLLFLFFKDYEKLVDMPRWKSIDGSIDRYTLGRMIEMTVFIRLLGIMALLYELRSMRLIIETMRNMIVPLLQLLSVLFVVFYIFSIMGMLLFGGMN